MVKTVFPGTASHLLPPIEDHGIQISIYPRTRRWMSRSIRQSTCRLMCRWIRPLISPRPMTTWSSRSNDHRRSMTAEVLVTSNERELTPGVPGVSVMAD